MRYMLASVSARGVYPIVDWSIWPIDPSGLRYDRELWIDHLFEIADSDSTSNNATPAAVRSPRAFDVVNSRRDPPDM